MEKELKLDLDPNEFMVWLLKQEDSVKNRLIREFTRSRIIEYIKEAKKEGRDEDAAKVEKVLVEIDGKMIGSSE